MHRVDASVLADPPVTVPIEPDEVDPVRLALLAEEALHARIVARLSAEPELSPGPDALPTASRYLALVRDLLRELNGSRTLTVTLGYAWSVLGQHRLEAELSGAAQLGNPEWARGREVGDGRRPTQRAIALLQVLDRVQAASCVTA